MRRSFFLFARAGTAVLGIWASGCLLDAGPFEGAGNGGQHTGGTTGQGASTGLGGSGAGSTTTPPTGGTGTGGTGGTGLTGGGGTGATGAVGGSGGTGGTTVAFCGDGNKDTGEDCDDGNAIETDDCLSNCQVASCGDSFVHTGVEECDDGNQDNTDACLSTCVAASCGDGFVHAGVEACDDDNQDNTDACLTTCVAASCGDGFVHAGVEDCEDANAVEGDGCFACKADCGCPGCTVGNICNNCGPSGAATGYIMYKSAASKHCYMYAPPAISWDLARTACMTWGADLAALSTTNEVNEVTSATLIAAINADTGRCWLGGTDKAAEGTWLWVNGEQFNFPAGIFPWEAGEPNGGNTNNCLAIGQNAATLTFRDNDCATGRPYICERVFP